MLPLKNLLSILNPAVRTITRTNCYRAAFGIIKRPIYSRLYPVTLVKPDGSSITIKYHEPLAIIKMPFNLDKLDETERKRRMMKRQMSNKVASAKKTNSVIIDKDIKFDPRKYLKTKRDSN